MSDPNRITQFLLALINPIQAVEEGFQDLLTERAIDTAFGAQLDQLGVIVNQPRDGLSDDDYRRFIRARVAANRSSGVTEQLIRIAQLLVGDLLATYQMVLWGTASYALRILNHATEENLADIIIGFLDDASAGGVRPILESCSQPPSTWERFDLDHFDTTTGHMITARDHALG